MPSSDSPAILVARFLQTNNYTETLSTLLTEAGLPQDAGVTQPGDLTIEKVLEEKKVFDLSVNFEKIGVGDEDKSWRLPAPTAPTPCASLPSQTNLLHVSIVDILGSPGPSRAILATTADRRLNILSTDAPEHGLLTSLTHLHDSPILSCAVIHGEWLLTSSMSGQVVLSDQHTHQVLDEIRDHTKYVVKVAVYEEDASEDRESRLVATAGWDQKVFIYRPSSIQDEGEEARPSQRLAKLGKPIASITLPTNPECIVFMKHPDSSEPVLIISRRDSTFLYFYGASKESTMPSSQPDPPPQLTLLGRQNLAPHSNAWVAFSPSSFALCPSDPTLLAVATSSVPHMKILFVRLLLPRSPVSGSTAAHPPNTAEAEFAPAAPATQAAQTRAALRVADDELAAILSHTSTLAPQTPYSTPQVCWRPDGSGVWVNGDDGAVRGIEARTGKILETLTGGHDAGSKVRCICAGTDLGGREVMVSGGFDRKLVIWSVGEDNFKDESLERMHE